jgi:hypothetical protein
MSRVLDEESLKGRYIAFSSVHEGKGVFRVKLDSATKKWFSPIDPSYTPEREVSAQLIQDRAPSIGGPHEALMLINFGSKGGANSIGWESGSVALENRPANAVVRRFPNRLMAQTAIIVICLFWIALMIVSWGGREL